MSARKLIGKVSATEKNPSSCDEFQFWLSDDTILSPFDIVLVENKTDNSITLNCTPFVRQYGILSNEWGVCYAKRSTKQKIYARIQDTGR